MENTNLKSLAGKIVNVQSSVGKLTKDQDGYISRYKFFDINQLLAELQPHLIEQGLAVLQPLTNLNGLPAIRTIVIDKDSGESIESTICFADDLDPQKVGSKITYYRRYSLQSMFGLQAEDDDAHTATKPTKQAVKAAIENPWLNIYVKGTKDLTPEMKEVYNEMKMGGVNSVQDLRKDWAINKAAAATLEAWFLKLKK
tara:strand:- start:85 stop:681 length:597 start_codon:yes stop_codon:yes gene_type:complete